MIDFSKGNGCDPDGYNDRRSRFLPADFGGPADGPTMPHIGTLARLIIKYPGCQLLGKKLATDKNIPRSNILSGALAWFSKIANVLHDAPQMKTRKII